MEQFLPLGHTSQGRSDVELLTQVEDVNEDEDNDDETVLPQELNDGENIHGSTEETSTHENGSDSEDEEYVNPFVGNLTRDHGYLANRLDTIGVKDALVLVHVLVDAAPCYTQIGVREYAIKECMDRLEFKDCGRGCDDTILEETREDMAFYYHHFYDYENVNAQFLNVLFQRRNECYSFYQRGMIPEKVLKLSSVMTPRADVTDEKVRYFPYYMMLRLVSRLGYCECRYTIKHVLWSKWMIDKGHEEKGVLDLLKISFRELEITSQLWATYREVQLIRKVLESVMDIMDIRCRDEVLQALIERRFEEAAENSREYYRDAIVI